MPTTTTHPDYSSLLYKQPNARVVLTKKQMQSFVAANIRTDGAARVVVNGEVRELVWRSLTGGLYSVYSVALTTPPSQAV